MFWNIWIGFLAAVGALLLLWLLWGAVVPMAAFREVAVSCTLGGEYDLLRRYRWLRELGLCRCRLCLLDSQLPPEAQKQILEKYPGVRFCTPEQWLQEQTERLEEHG